MKTVFKLGLVASSAMLLAGCQSAPFAGWFGKSQPGRTASASPKVDGAQLVEEGRALLAEGRISAAVATLRLARLDPATAAQAENGLGVAYAKLGRVDLADRYFRAAIARDPSDMRFSANLLRLQHEVLMANRAAAQVRMAQVEPAAVIEKPTPLAASHRVHRATRGEVMIRTSGELSAAPSMAVVYRVPRAKDIAPKTTDSADPAAMLARADTPTSKELVFPQ